MNIYCCRTYHVSIWSYLFPLLSIIPVTEATFPPYTSLEYHQTNHHTGWEGETCLWSSDHHPIIRVKSNTCQSDIAPLPRFQQIGLNVKSFTVKSSQADWGFVLWLLLEGTDQLSEQIINWEFYNHLFEDKTYNIITKTNNKLLPAADPDGDAALTVDGGQVRDVRVLELVAPHPPPDWTESGAEFISAPHQSFPQIVQIITRAKAAQSLPAAGTEPIQSFFQSGPAGSDPLQLHLGRLTLFIFRLSEMAVVAVVRLILMYLCIINVRTYNSWAP